MPTMEPRRIISASRRTDLPGWHAEWLAARLRALRTPVHSVFFWTRFPAAFVRPGPLRDALRAVENPFVHLTMTGLGGTPLEPRVPPTDDVFATLPALIDLLHGQPERLLWRCDPLLRERHTPDRLARLFERCAAHGLRSCTISLPATQSLKGDLTPQLAASGIAPWPAGAGTAFVRQVAAIAGGHGIRLAACATPALDPLVREGVIDRAQCISDTLAARLHPRGVPLELPKDSHQRRACACVASEDVGSYTDHPCHSGCGYCYSKAGGPVPGAPTTPGTPWQSYA
ncbi:MAG: DUF1848 family protein [Deltaproteobacteria bacterium]|nr:DUF1848 family protein [Deltaproteobacteria bacterium]